MQLKVCLDVTSVPVSQDAPVTRQIVSTSSSSDFKSMNALKFLFVFVCNCTIYLSGTLLTYQFRKLSSRRRRPLEFIESLLLHYIRTLRLAIPPLSFFTVGQSGQFTASSDRNRDVDIPLRLSDSTTQKPSHLD
jgi:hypothetical protein